MYNLILKDILIQKKIILLSFAYIVFFVIAMQGAGFVMYPTALTAITYMLVVTSCAYDDKNKADVMLNSLPIKRSSIVLAKYLSVIVYVVTGTVAYWVITTLLALTGLPVKIYPVSSEGFAGGLLAIGFINSIYFPFYFKFGYIKSRFLNLILFFVFFFGLTSVVKFIYVQKDTSWVKIAAKFINSQTDLQIFTYIIVLTLVIMAVSLALSLRAYQGKDF